jgi:hypothetical protein
MPIDFESRWCGIKDAHLPHTGCDGVGYLYPLSEQRETDPVTGGEKGRKLEEYALIPPAPLAELARVYGFGAKKYEPNNWRKGYRWNLSISALYRHIEAWRQGETHDSESGLHHLAHAMFHLNTLMEFERLQLGTDDR